MGAGFHGGFGPGTKGAQDNNAANADRIKDTDNPSNSGNTKLPENEAQLKHIFSDREGHLSDTPENRKLLTDLSNDESKHIGEDKYGNSWNAEIASDGSQYWVRYQNGIINEGGKNTTPRPWNNETGYNNNPVKRRKKK